MVQKLAHGEDGLDPTHRRQSSLLLLRRCSKVRTAISFMALNLRNLLLLLLLEDKLAQLFNIDRAFEECLCS